MNIHVANQLAPVAPSKMNRRSLIASGLAAVVAVGAAPVLAAQARPTASARYVAELDAIDRETARLKVGRHGEAEWDRWEAWTNRVYDEIETLPTTPENVRIKARAIWSIIEGDMQDLNPGQTTVCRLVRQMVSSLAGGA